MSERRSRHCPRCYYGTCDQCRGLVEDDKILEPVKDLDKITLSRKALEARINNELVIGNHEYVAALIDILNGEI